MEKIKYLFVVAFLFVTTNVARAGGSSMPWCDCHVLVKSTGGGKVYVTPNSGSQTTANCTRTEYFGAIYGKTHDTKNAPAKIYLAAKPDNGWEFDYWECTRKYGDYDNASGATAVNTKLYDALPSYQKAALSIMYPKNNDGGDNTAVTATNDTNAIWIAHFKLAEMQTVKVESEQPSLGTANIDKITNYVGDEVTLSAWCGNSGNNPRSETIMFLGWYRLNEATGEKEFVTDDYIYTFTITEQNKGTYYARYASGYNFWRIKNVKYANYLTSVAHYDGPVTTTAVQSALQTQLSFDDDLATALTDEGSMMKLSISGYAPNTHREILDIYVQDEHTNQYYGEEAIAEGVFLQMSHQLDNTYYIQGNNGSFTITESSDKKVNISTSAPKSANWRFEGMDKDLTTKKNYFAVAPSEFVGPDNDGYYWTTLRVCFNMKYETSEITPFIVTSADASTGVMELTEVTGGIIPEKTCVLLRCNSTDVTRNVMIPTTTAASFSPTGNLLTSSTYYYKNQTVASSENLKALKLVDGRLGFGGSTKTSVDGNRAYLSVANDVAVPTPITPATLANIISNNNVGDDVIVSDDLLVMEALTSGNQTVLIAKDLGNYQHPDENTSNAYDYMLKTGLQTSYDQSNWVMLTSNEFTSNNISNYSGQLLVDGTVNGKLLTRGSVKGKLTDKRNPVISLSSMPTAGGTQTYTPNKYIVPSFCDEYAAEGSDFFFVQPKPQEYCTVMWATYDATTDAFFVPQHAPGVNVNSLKGGISWDNTYLGSQGSSPINNHVYTFNTVVNKLPDPKESYNVWVHPLNNANDLVYDQNDYHTYIYATVNGQEVFGGWPGKRLTHMRKAYYKNGEYSYWYYVSFGTSKPDFIIFSRGDDNKKTLNINVFNNAGDYFFNYFMDYDDINYRCELLSDYSSTPPTINGAPRRSATATPFVEGGISSQYIVMPLFINEDSVITGINTVNSDATPVQVLYYNPIGLVSIQPFNGINIMVTRYSDGTTTTKKVIQ